MKRILGMILLLSLLVANLNKVYAQPLNPGTDVCPVGSAQWVCADVDCPGGGTGRTCYVYDPLQEYKNPVFLGCGDEAQIACGTQCAEECED